jgi:RNA polymerase sigma-70 factor, ECF subfamily
VTVAERDWLAARFEEHRPRLRAVAYRVLGSRTEAEDAVQEAWFRFSRADTSSVADLGSWLTTVVSRLCLNMLQARRSRPELSLESALPELPAHPGQVLDPEEEAILADSIGVAMLVVLETLTPAERVAFVLHDMFAVPFDEIGQILGRAPAAARQLASRARRRVQGRGVDRPADGIAHAKLVDAFLGAARRADFRGLLEILDPDVVLRPDQAAVRLGAEERLGAEAVASWFSGRAAGARAALVNGRAGAAWMPGGSLRVVFKFVTRGGRIAGIELVADPENIRRIDLVVPGWEPRSAGSANNHD